MSSVVEAKFIDLVDKLLDFIWKEMHCHTLKISLYHFWDEGDETKKLHVNVDLKKNLKGLGFKWKQIT
jgi:hypothetical protein